MVGYPYLIISVLKAAHLLREPDTDDIDLDERGHHGPRASTLRHVINAAWGSLQLW